MQQNGIDFELIWRQLHKLTTLEEDIKIKQWLNESEINRRFYANAKKYYYEGSQLSNRPELLRLSWNKFNRNLKAPQRKIISKYFFLTGIAASLLIFLGIRFYINAETKIIPVSEPIVSIIPGGNKASLIINDGSILDLSSAENNIIIDGLSEIKNTGSELVYLDSPSPKEENNFHTIIVPRGGEYKLMLSDGTQVWLNSETTLRFPVKFSGNYRKVELTGEAYFEVSKSTNNMPFIVVSGEQKLEVLGTHFNLTAYPDNEYISTTLIEGAVSVTLSDNIDQNIVLQSNDQSQLLKKDKIFSVRQVDPTPFIAWKDGRFIFYDQTLEEIMKSVSRWYDIDIVFSNTQISDIRFTCNLQRYSNFEEFLSVLERTKEVQFSIEGKTIYIN